MTAEANPSTESPKRSENLNFLNRRIIFWISIEIAALSFAIMLSLMAKEFADQKGLTNGYLAAKFFVSPGFAGCLAVFAAAIGFFAVHRQLNHNRLELAHEKAAEANKTWWATFQWVADKILSAEKDHEGLSPTIAAAMLLDLSRDELGASSASTEFSKLWESRQRACNGLALELSSKIDPSSSLGQEVLESLTNLSRQGPAGFSTSPMLEQQLTTLSTLKAMYQKLSVFGSEHDMEVITNPEEMMQRLPPDSGRRKAIADALVTKNNKYVWVNLSASSRNINGQLRHSTALLGPNISTLDTHPFVFAFHGLTLEKDTLRIDLPNYVHVVTDNDTSSESLSKKLKELLD